MADVAVARPGAPRVESESTEPTLSLDEVSTEHLRQLGTSNGWHPCARAATGGSHEPRLRAVNGAVVMTWGNVHS